MIFGLVGMWLHDLLRHMPTGHNDFGATENVKVRNSEFPPWNFLWQLPVHYTTLQLQLQVQAQLQLQQLQLHYFTLRYTSYTSLYHCTIHNTTVHYITLITHCNCNCHCTTLITLHYNYDSTTLYFNYNYNCITPHYIQQLWWGDPCNHCSHSKKHNSNHLSVHQWIRSALRDSQQPLVQVSYFWIFRHRVVRHYWYGTGGCEQNRQRQWTKTHPFKMFQGTAAAIFSL